MKILVLCTGNSCRSQMAEGLLRHAHPDWHISSAGTLPALAVSRRTIYVMKEIGIDISQQYPKSVNLFLNDAFDVVLTVCDHAKDSCPAFTGLVKQTLHIGFPDPTKIEGDAEFVLQKFRDVRDTMNEALMQLNFEC